jgi:tripeptidyl-peptidase-1
MLEILILTMWVLVQYNIPNATLAAPGNELGIFESLDVHYSRHDLDIYYSTLYP